MNKKGINYIELILSFTLFVGFVIILFIYLNPVKQPSISEVLLDSVQENLESNASIILTEIPFKAETSSDCFKTTEFNDILAGLASENIFIEDDFGNSVDFSFGDELKVEKGSSDIYHLFYSTEASFSTDAPSCTNVEDINSPDNPIISTPRSFDIFSKNRLGKLNENYYADYSGLKKRFDIPELGDFAIIINDENNNPMFQMTRNVPKGINVQAREYPISILDEISKKRIRAFINIRVW